MVMKVNLPSNMLNCYADGFIEKGGEIVEAWSLDTPFEYLEMIKETLLSTRKTAEEELNIAKEYPTKYKIMIKKLEAKVKEINHSLIWHQALEEYNDFITYLFANDGYRERFNKREEKMPQNPFTYGSDHSPAFFGKNEKGTAVAGYEETIPYNGNERIINAVFIDKDN